MLAMLLLMDPVDDLGPVTAEEQALALELSAWQREFLGTDGDDRAWACEPETDAERAEAMLARPAGLLDVLLLEDLDPAMLASKALQLRVSRRIDELTAMLAARQATVTAALAGEAPSGSYLDEVHAETEIALARTISPTLAGLEIETARALATTFPQFLAALSRGAVSVAHCRRLVEATRFTTDADALRLIGDTALPQATKNTVALFGRALRRLIIRHDPDAAGRRREKVRASRDVTVDRLDDGLGRLVYVDEWSRVNAVSRRIRAAGRATQVARKQAASAARAGTPGRDSSRSRRKAARKAAAAEVADRRRTGGAGEAVEAAACRADALLALVLGAEQADGSVVLDTGEVVRVDCLVVIDLATARAEADRMALLDGEPVPADVGRAWARQARGFRRMVTDPVTGHLLDHGRRYLADDVRDFVLARDGGCRVPVCGISHPDRLQADHAVPAPEGPTSSANLGALSTTHHQLKTAGYLDVADSRSDGSAILTTAWGQRIVIPPRAFLDDPEPAPGSPGAPPAPNERPDDPPPF